MDIRGFNCCKVVWCFLYKGKQLSLICRIDLFDNANLFVLITMTTSINPLFHSGGETNTLIEGGSEYSYICALPLISFDTNLKNN